MTLKDFPTKDFQCVEKDVSLKNYTTFKIGGRCPMLINACSVGEINRAMRMCKELNLKLFVLGNGSNVLALDGGFDGVVLHLGHRFAQVWCEGESVFALAGTSVKSVADCALKNLLSGAEFLSTIPATVGGAVYMNAGCFGSDTAGILNRVWAADGEKEIEFYREDLDFGYRKSPFQENGLIVTKAEFTLCGCNEGFIASLGRELMSIKRVSQPLDAHSAGSVFKRQQGVYAGQLVDLAGLKGLQIGGACVSEKHAGFVINKGGACSEDVLTLIDIVKNRVRDKFGVALETEIVIMQ